MAPEDDVNKEAAHDADEHKPADSASTESSAKANGSKKPDSPDRKKAQTGNTGLDGSDPLDMDDIDRAASAQGESDDDADDPLGFGNKRMDGADDELTRVREQLAESETQVASMKDQLLRLQAEMENQRKRAQNDVTKAHKFALEKFALDLLPVKDSLEMGLLAATAEDAEPSKIVEGSELTLKMLAQALEKYNIIEINPIDEKFDPEFHQAMTMQPVEGKEHNTVASVMQKGYTLNDRLIRPALVMVVK